MFSCVTTGALNCSSTPIAAKSPWCGATKPSKDKAFVSDGLREQYCRSVFPEMQELGSVEQGEEKWRPEMMVQKRKEMPLRQGRGWLPPDSDTERRYEVQTSLREEANAARATCCYCKIVD